MFGIDFGEVVLIAFVTILIFGPNEFPVKMRQLYAFFAKFKTLAAEAQANFSKMSMEIEDQVKPMMDSSKALWRATESESMATVNASSSRPAAVEEGWLAGEKSEYSSISVDAEEFLELKNQSHGDYASMPMAIPKDWSATTG